MLVPDSLWLPSAKDAQAQLAAETVSQQLTISGLLAQINVQSNPIPADRVFILTWFAVRATPGGAQTVDQWELDIHPVASGASAAAMLRFERVGGVNATYGQAFSCQVWVPPGAFLSLAVDFSAGAVLNEARLAWHGLLFPRGTIQVGGF